MATFYLLPPRAELTRHWTDYLRQWLPGLEDPGIELVDQIIALVHRLPSVYAVFADELPNDGDVRGALSASFGAEPGDQVFDLRGAVSVADGVGWRSDRHFRDEADGRLLE